jgi:hypothetical protein
MHATVGHVEIFIAAVKAVFEEHIFVIAAEADNVADCFPDIENGIDNPFWIRATVDIVADENECVILRIDIKLRHQLVKLKDAAVDISYGEYLSHTEILLFYVSPA